MDNIKEKIKKLFALGEDVNNYEHEREQAMSKAQELLAMHNLERADIDGHRERIEVEEKFHDLRLEKWKRIVISGACKLYYTSYFMTPRGSQGYSPVFVGTPENVEITIDIATWLIKSIAKESNKKFSGKHARDSFRLGAAMSLYEQAAKLRDQQLSPGASTGTSLMVLRNELERANEDYKARLGLRKHQARSTSVNPYAYQAGGQYGNTINLNKQIGQNIKQISQN